MKKTIYFLMFLFITGSLLAFWNGTDHKMHFPQPPDPGGYDVQCTFPRIVADDWQCTGMYWIERIYFWISVKGDGPWGPMLPPDYINFIHISIHSDNPMGPNGYSIPDQLLWERDFWPTEFAVNIGEEGLQGWYDPLILPPIYPDHTYYYEVAIENIINPQCQIPGNIYWLDVSIDINPVYYPPFDVGWKTTTDPWNDYSVHSIDGGATWFLGEMMQFDQAFVIDGDVPCPVELSSFSTSFVDGNAILNWITQSETNNLGWNIYRGESHNALQDNETTTLNFILIPGAGTTSEPTDYQFTDEYPVIECDTYWYWLESVDGAGDTEIYGPVTLTVPEEEPIPVLPQTTFLCNNYPNPFNPSTFIKFSIKEGENGSLTIYNAKGQLLENHQYEVGEHQLKWDAKQYGSGIYFYKLETQSYTETKKMIMLK